VTDDNGRPRHPRLTHQQAVEIALNDPAARAQIEQNPRVIQARRLYAENASGLLKDLNLLGFEVESVGELARQNAKYEAVIPLLLRWLPRVNYLPLAEDIVRTLSVPFARKYALPEFLALFRSPPEVANPMRPMNSGSPKESLRWVIGNGLGVFAGPSIANELIELALDRKYGQARTQIVLSLPKTKDERIAEVLISLLDDQTVNAFAVEALGKMKAAVARESIVQLEGHPEKIVRDQVKKALKRIDAAR
jgi:hypothetical protein